MANPELEWALVVGAGSIGTELAAWHLSLGRSVQLVSRTEGSLRAAEDELISRFGGSVLVRLRTHAVLLADCRQVHDFCEQLAHHTEYRPPDYVDLACGAFAYDEHFMKPDEKHPDGMEMLRSVMFHHAANVESKVNVLAGLEAGYVARMHRVLIIGSIAADFDPEKEEDRAKIRSCDMRHLVPRIETEIGYAASQQMLARFADRVRLRYTDARMLFLKVPLVKSRIQEYLFGHVPQEAVGTIQDHVIAPYACWVAAAPEVLPLM